MLVSRVARRYAEALYTSVPAETGTDRFLADLRDIRASIAGSRELWNFFVSPTLTMTKKREAVRALFADRIDSYTIGALEFLVEKQREALVLEIIQGVLELDRSRRAVEVAELTSAHAIGDDQRRRIDSVLEQLTGKSIEPDYRIDSSLIGGVVARVGDTVYDGSISRQLQILRARLIAG